eukprot:5354684-Amphidinium_carterae.1
MTNHGSTTPKEKESQGSHGSRALQVWLVGFMERQKHGWSKRRSFKQQWSCAQKCLARLTNPLGKAEAAQC